MSPDDERHGTYAGFHAHKKVNEAPCEPCRAAQRRYYKSMKLRLHRGQRARVTLGEEAWRIIDNNQRATLAKATGIRPEHLLRFHKTGPTAGIYATTRDRILSAGRTGLVTPVGLQRRLRALMALGYSAAWLAEEMGTHHETLMNTVNLDRAPVYLRADMTARILETYDRLHMTVRPPSRSKTLTLNIARAKGFLPPLAWDDIDNPDEKPYRATRDDAVKPMTEVDHAVIARILDGQKTPANLAEKREAIRTWAAMGKPEGELMRRQGWHQTRYREDVA